MTRPRPDEPPECCSACHGLRVWWPCAGGYAPACPWCDRSAMSDPPDDIDHDADTLLEPVTTSG